DDGLRANNRILLGLTDCGIHDEAHGGDWFAIAVAQRHHDRTGAFFFAIINSALAEHVLLDLGAELADLLLLFAGNQSRGVGFAAGDVNLKAHQTVIFLEHVAGDHLRRHFARPINDFSVREVAYRVGFGPETNLAAGEGAVGERGD